MGADADAAQTVVAATADDSAADSAGRIERLPRAALWVALGRGLGIASTLLATIIVPRLLAPREFGELTTLLSIVMFGSIVAQLGLGPTCVRFLAESLARHDLGRLRRTLAQASGLLSFSSLLVVAIVAAMLWRWGENLLHLRTLAWVVPLAAVLILMMAWQQFSAESLRGLHELRLASLLSGGTFGGPVPVLLFLAVLAAVATQGAPTIATTLLCQIFGSGVSLAVSVLCLWLAVRAVSGAGSGQVSPPSASSTIIDLLGVCLPMAVFQFLVIVMQTADIWMAAYYFPLEGVALYGAARRYLVLLQVPMQLSVNTVISSVPDLYVRGRTAELQALLRRSAAITALATIAISLLCVFLGGWLMGALSGSFYQQGATALVILSAGQVIVALVGSGEMALAMTGRQTAAMWICLASVILLCIAGPLAAWQWGIAGIAAASASATAFQAVAEWLVCRRLLGIWTHADLRPQALYEMLAALIVWIRKSLGFAT